MGRYHDTEIQTLAVVFGILAAALAALAVYQSRRGKKTETAKAK